MTHKTMCPVQKQGAQHMNKSSSLILFNRSVTGLLDHFILVSIDFVDYPAVLRTQNPL